MRPIGLVEHGLCLRCCNGEVPRGPLAHRFCLLRPFQGRRAGDPHAIKFASYRLENERRTPQRPLGRLRGPCWLMESGCLRGRDWTAPSACACNAEQTVRRLGSERMAPPARAGCVGRTDGTARLRLLCGADGAQAQQRLDGTARPRWLCGAGDAQARQRGVCCRACANALSRGRSPVASS